MTKRTLLPTIAGLSIAALLASPAAAQQIVGTPGAPGAIIVCRACGRTHALDIEIDTEIDRICRAAGFKAERLIAEIVGLCPRCRQISA